MKFSIRPVEPSFEHCYRHISPFRWTEDQNLELKSQLKQTLESWNHVHGSADEEASDGLDYSHHLRFGLQRLDRGNPWPSCLWCLWRFFHWPRRPCSWWFASSFQYFPFLFCNYGFGREFLDYIFLLLVPNLSRSRSSIFRMLFSEILAFSLAMN